MSDTFFWRPSSVTVSGRACIFTHPIKDDDGAVVVELVPRHTTITLLVALASTCQSVSLDHLELKEQMQHSRHNTRVQEEALCELHLLINVGMCVVTYS